jgi:hypothetical protein
MRKFIEVRHVSVQEQSEFESTGPANGSLRHNDIGRIVCRPDTKTKMRADFHRHAAADTATVFMDINDAALSHELSAAIEHTP